MRVRKCLPAFGTVYVFNQDSKNQQEVKLCGKITHETLKWAVLKLVKWSVLIKLLLPGTQLERATKDSKSHYLITQTSFAYRSLMLRSQKRHWLEGDLFDLLSRLVLSTPRLQSPYYGEDNSIWKIETNERFFSYICEQKQNVSFNAQYWFLVKLLVCFVTNLDKVVLWTFFTKKEFDANCSQNPKQTRILHHVNIDYSHVCYRQDNLQFLFHL